MYLFEVWLCVVILGRLFSLRYAFRKYRTIGISNCDVRSTDSFAVVQSVTGLEWLKGLQEVKVPQIT